MIIFKRSHLWGQISHHCKLQFLPAPRADYSEINLRRTPNVHERICEADLPKSRLSIILPPFFFWEEFGPEEDMKKYFAIVTIWALGCVAKGNRFAFDFKCVSVMTYEYCLVKVNVYLSYMRKLLLFSEPQKHISVWKFKEYILNNLNHLMANLLGF